MKTKAQLDTLPRVLGALALFGGVLGCESRIHPKDPAPDPACGADELEFTSEHECLRNARACHQEGDLWCGEDVPPECCAQQPICEPHQLTFGDEEACNEAGETCREVKACCIAISCAADGSALEAELTFPERAASVEFTAGEGLYVLTCSDAFVLEKAGAGPGTYTGLVDERPWATNGAFMLDGVLHEQVFAGEGCDVIGCTPLADTEVERVEYVTSPADAEAPADIDPGPGLPELVSRTVSGPVRVTARVYADSDCQGASITRTFEAVAP